MIQPQIFPQKLLGVLALICLAPLSIASAQEQDAQFSWQKQHAKVLPTGDLEWAPLEFQYTAGEEVRYIDFENGDDSNPGTKEQPWKHHPWDPDAGGQAKADTGADTFVFKGGVEYRGNLTGGRSGSAEQPIRITRDPAWGEGPAVILGSEQVAEWTKGADHPDIPEAENVYYADLDFAPRTLWMVGEDGEVTRIKLARTPNWEESDPVDVRSEWWRMNNPWVDGGNKDTVDGKTMHQMFDPENLTEDADYYEGALLWPEWGVMMGGPYATPVERFDEEKKAISFRGPWPKPDSGRIFSDHRYYLEDKPHYLDEPGEFWFQKEGDPLDYKRGEGGRLFVRLPGDVDPNTVRVEAGRHSRIMEFEDLNHIEISGLTLRFGNVFWELHGFFFQDEVLDPAIIFKGRCQGIAIKNNRIEHAGGGIRFEPGYMDDLAVNDNEILHIDQEGLNMYGSTGNNNLVDVEVLRNRFYDIGQRAVRANRHVCLRVHFPLTAEIAGNMMERTYAAGIFVHAGKGSGAAGVNAPFARVIIHHNRAVRTMLGSNDWGGIETWQGGPYYVYNNVSGDPVGPFYWTGRTFAFAYYMDGAFKNYLFNNIAWGRNNNLDERWTNVSAFQEIHSYQNNFFNNTAYKFEKGSRRQKPEPGRNQFLGNIWQDISENVFRHTDAEGQDPNVHHAGKQGMEFDFYTNAYGNNVFYNIGDVIASFEPDGGEYRKLEEFQKALAARKSLDSEVGVFSEIPPTVNAAEHDFRPAPGSAAIDFGVKPFVPWSLYATVGEWEFVRNNADPSSVIDNSWYMTPYHVGRDDYEDRPSHPLQGVNITAESYVQGELEDWAPGAVQLNGQDQFFKISNATLTEPYEYSRKKETVTVTGKDLKNPMVHDTSFIIEAYLKIEGSDNGVLAQNTDGSTGWILRVQEDGNLQFALQDGSNTMNVTSDTPVNGGSWHHVLAEVDRENDKMNLFIDGKPSGSTEGVGKLGTLANSGDFLVGGTPDGNHLAMTLDFMRVALGSLEQSQTTIEELVAWQFDGPFLRDFTGAAPTGQKRDAGALELQE